MRYYSKNNRDTRSERCPECHKPIQIGQSTVTADNALYHLDCAFLQHKTDTTNHFVRRIVVGLEILLIMTVIILMSAYYSKTQEISPSLSIVTYEPDEPVVKLKYLTNKIIFVRVITYPSYRKLRAANLKKDKIQFVGKLLGWYIMRNAICEIHVLEPKLVKSVYPAKTWGHELMHCTYGNYHK